jgi:hypothetical protein
LVLILGTFAQTYIFASSAMFVLAALVAASGFVGSAGLRRRYNVGS